MISIFGLRCSGTKYNRGPLLGQKSNNKTTALAQLRTCEYPNTHPASYILGDSGKEEIPDPLQEFGSRNHAMPKGDPFPTRDVTFHLPPSSRHCRESKGLRSPSLPAARLVLHTTPVPISAGCGKPRDNSLKLKCFQKARPEEVQRQYGAEELAKTDQN